MVGRLIGRSRVYTLNPAYFASPELAAYLLRLSDADTALRSEASRLRRRPRWACDTTVKLASTSTLPGPSQWAPNFGRTALRRCSLAAHVGRSTRTDPTCRKTLSTGMTLNNRQTSLLPSADHRNISGKSRSQAWTRGVRVTDIDQLGANGRGTGCIQIMGVNGCNIGSCSDPTLSRSPRKS